MGNRGAAQKIKIQIIAKPSLVVALYALKQVASPADSLGHRATRKSKINKVIIIYICKLSNKSHLVTYLFEL